MPFKSARGTFNLRAYAVKMPRDGRKLPPKWEPAKPDEYPNDIPPGEVRGDLLERALRLASERESFLRSRERRARHDAWRGRGMKRPIVGLLMSRFGAFTPQAEPEASG